MSNKSLEERIQSLEDIHEIKNLMSRYEYLHTASRHQETADLFAKKTPGVRAEIGNWGIYEGVEGIQRLYVDIHKWGDRDRKGVIFLHTLTTPIIEVAGDGKTAKGVWTSPGIETSEFGTEGLKGCWAWAKYGVDFVKEDGEWKFWHIKVYGLFHCDYYTSWVDQPSILEEQPLPTQIPEELRADRPPSSFWMYSKDAVTELDPVPPEPYETWDDSMSFIPAAEE
jgi:hypothetical protein